jgi:predicted PurR-regulated permease PerM
MLRPDEPIAGGAGLWRARYERGHRLVRHVRRRVRKLMRTQVVVGVALALVAGLLLLHFGM